MSSTEGLKKQADELVDAGNYQQAVSIFKQILEIDAQDHEAWYYLALTYIELEKHKDAEEALTKALTYDSENTEYLLQLGYLKHMSGDVEGSTEIFNQIIDIDPMNPDALSMLGLIAKDEERFQDAIDLLEASFANDEDLDILVNIIECNLDLGDLDKAEKNLEKLSQSELEGDQFETERELLARFYLDKAMSSWTGTSTNDEGETLYYPETMEQINDAEHYLECAEIRKPKDEFYINRIQQLKEVVDANKSSLLSEDNSLIESSGDSETEQNSDFTPQDKEAWAILDEIYYDIWTDIEEDEGVEYHWPNTLEEVNESKKVLKKAKKIKYQSQEVKDRIKAIDEVLESSKKWLPNYTMKFVRAFAFSILAIVVFFILANVMDFKKPEFDFNPTDWVVSQSTKLGQDSFIGSKGYEFKQNISLNSGTQLTPVARMGTYWAQVETQSGQRGFVFYRKLKGAKKPISNRNTVIYTDLSKKTVVDSVFLDEAVSVLSYHKDGEESVPYIAKVRNSRGKIGYMWDYALDYPFFEALPRISQTTTFPTTLKNIENKVIGKNVTDIEKKFGPVTSMINSGGKKIAYFRQINVVKDKKKFRGIFFTLDNRNVAKSYELNKETKYKFLESLPLAQSIRSMELFTILGFDFYKSEDVEISWWEKFRQINWFTKVIGFLVMAIIGLTGIFLFFSVPRLIINPFMLMVSHGRFFSNGIVLMLNWVLYAFATYFFFLWMALLMNQILTPLICALPTFYLWWKIHHNNIKYNRCPDCHTMNVGIDKGTTFRGKSKHISHGTHDVYKGKTETSTQIIHNYERRSTKTTEVIRHYTDHRQCIRCGFEWGVARQETESRNTQYL